VEWRLRGRRRRPLGTAEEAATFETLHAASLMAPLLRRGFDPAHAAQALTHVRTLLGTPTVAILDASGPLAWDGPERTDDVDRLVADVLSSGTTQASRSAVVAPLAVDNRVVGALLAALALPCELGPLPDLGRIGKELGNVGTRVLLRLSQRRECRRQQ